MAEGASGSDNVNARVRGIYTTALTHVLSETEDFSVVQASGPIQRRFDSDFPQEPADVTVATDATRLGVRIEGTEHGVERVSEALDLGRDVFGWPDPTPTGAIFEGRVTETLGSGAIVDIGPGEGFLPYSATQRHVETGDHCRVQVASASPPWDDDRAELQTTISVDGELATLYREKPGATRGPDLLDVLSVELPDGWRVSWGTDADDVEFPVLESALESKIERAERLDTALEGFEGTGRADAGRATHWMLFGRESRFELDEYRRKVTTTMPGHHRIKAGTEQASAAVDFVETLAPTLDDTFPFDVVTRQFGPGEGDQIAIEHGKPAGHTIGLGYGEVTDHDPEGKIRVEREMSSGGTYDALGVKRQSGDVAITTFTEGKWWYPTIYRGEDGEKRGMYVNVCTPVEVFPDAVRYVDLHVDVVKHADGTIERVDDDELDSAVEAGHINQELADKARSVAGAVENAL